MFSIEIERILSSCSPTCIMISLRCTEHPPMYSWYPSDVLNTPRCTHDIPPMYLDEMGDISPRGDVNLSVSFGALISRFLNQFFSNSDRYLRRVLTIVRGGGGGGGEAKFLNSSCVPCTRTERLHTTCDTIKLPKNQSPLMIRVTSIYEQ